MGAGLLLAASFPKIGIAGFAWIAPGLVLLAALGTRGGECFCIGYVAGLAHYLASLYWLLLIPYRWHSIPLDPAAGWLALSAFLALYPATWVWLSLKILGFGFRVSGLEAARGTQFETRNLKLETLLPPSWSRRTLWSLASAAIWVALEMILTRLLGGFPWNLLGASQYQIVPLIQIASVTGVYGMSFLLVWGSLSLLCAASAILGRPHLHNAWMGEIILPLLVVVALFISGFHRLRQWGPPARELKVTLVQPSIPQTLIWNPENDYARFRDLVRLSEQALTNETDLLIWPESAIPKMLRYDPEIQGPVENLARSHRVWMIVGSDDAEPRRGSTDPNDAEFYNSSFLISPDGRLMARYRKRSLVIFGEYIPLEHWLPIFKFFTPAQGSFTPGDRAVQFQLGDLRAQASVLICFEDVFPQLARASAGPDTDFLVNITNDGWFGESAAQWQHCASAIFRTVENGLPLVRCANTGLTCWIDATGRLREIFRDENGSVYGAGFMTVKIPLLLPGEKRPPTFYNQHGDWFGWSCVALAAFMIASTSAFPLRRSRPEPGT